MVPQLLALAGIFAGLPAAASAVLAEPRHGIAMHGAPDLPPGFSHFPYAAPEAPKGGRVVLGAPGSFDSLNPLIVKGEAAAGVREYVIESLLARSLDEPFTLYGLLAESVETPEDRSWVTFRLDPRAKFSDGHPVTAADVLFSWELLRDAGRPNYRTYYRKVTKAERLDVRTVRFVFGTANDREMPLILGLMPILPAHLTRRETFEQTSLDPMTGSGPYRIARIEPGRTIAFHRDPAYWGRDLPVNRGRFNFDEIRYEYFRDGTAQFEAFKDGALDLRTEEDPSRWFEGYAIPAVADGRILKAEIPTGLPAGMNALVFNTRRPVFADSRVRRALIYLFDFEWINRNLFHGLYRRTQSYFERSELSSHGHPASPRERELLSPFPEAVTSGILEGRHSFPQSDGSGHNRANWQKAYSLLTGAGYVLRGGQLVKSDTGAPLAFEILTLTGGQERMLASFAADLARLGIAANIRVTHSAQFELRRKTYDFDMIPWAWPASLSPGNEQLFRWSSRAAREDGTFNLAGVANPAVDAMIAALLAATSREDFTAAVRALDRVLLSGDYVIPLSYLPVQWVAHWNRLASPPRPPLAGFTLDTWWSTEARPDGSPH